MTRHHPQVPPPARPANMQARAIHEQIEECLNNLEKLLIEMDRTGGWKSLGFHSFEGYVTHTVDKHDYLAN